jgi:adenine-specific DNA-methyltransferase
MGNKRKLLKHIENIIINLEEKEGRKLSIGDGFSGSGIVSRLFKQHADMLYTNDISEYSETLNSSFLSNINEEDLKNISKYVKLANNHADKSTKKYSKPYISGNWAPIGIIKTDDRVYFTKENGYRIDIMRNYIETLPRKYKPYLLASLLVEASIHNNTNGQFSAYYKNDGIGQYGGKHNLDLRRITDPINLKVPIFHNNKCKINISKMDTNMWVHKIPKLDLIYYDPPYNKHPYNIFYFLLNIINKWDINMEIPETYRGQPLNWDKSHYNSSIHAESALKDLIENTNSKYILLSYNSGGIIPLHVLEKILKQHGEVEIIPVIHKTYNRLRGISDYKRKHTKQEIKEYFWLLTKSKTD